jgi:hypothetical protein
VRICPINLSTLNLSAWLRIVPDSQERDSASTRLHQAFDILLGLPAGELDGGAGPSA